MAQHLAESGTLASGLPYATLGEAENDLVIFDTVRVNNRPLEGLRLQGARDAYEEYLEHRRIHIIERRNSMPIDYDVDDMVRDYEKAVPQLVEGSFDLMGVAGGGLMAIRFAARNPELLRSLTLISSALRVSEEGRTLLGQWSEWAEELQWRRIHRSLMQSMFANPLAGLFFGTIAFLAPETLGTTDYPWDFIVANRALQEADCSADAASLSVPTLITTGAKDPFFPPELAEQTAAAIPEARLSVYPRESHGLMKSRKAALRREILSFLEETAIRAA